MLPHNLRVPLLIIALALGLSLTVGTPRRAGAAGAGRSYQPDEIVVRLSPSAQGIDDLNSDLGTATITQIGGEAGSYLLRVPPGTDPATLAQSVALDPRLNFAEPNYIGGSPEADPRSIGAWGGLDPAPLLVQPALAQVHLVEAQAISRGAGVTVAIIDTGAQLDHPALAASFTPDGYDFVDNDSSPIDVADGIDKNGNGLADEAYGHGTHVAGIIHTVAPDAQLLVLRVLNSDGEGDMTDLVQAIDYAVAHGAGVINLSLGTSENSQLLKDAVRRATLGGVVVVAAAGNAGADQRQYPAAGNCAIAVTSVDANDLHSTFASYGGWVSVAAPGEGIFSAFPTSGYATWSGTSMATPFVSGEAALLISLKPSLNVRDVANLIGGTARSIDQLNPALDDLLGDGRIDLAASLRAVIKGLDSQPRHSHVTRSCIAQTQ
jgi:subtilisin family serine protease